jgi:acetyl/propionyl-CoA carboxylase alpha subunit
MLGKLIAWGADRNEAIARLKRALAEYYASGIKTNVSLFRRILASEDFVSAAIYTRWLDDFLKRPVDESPLDDAARDAALIGTALWHRSRSGGASKGANGNAAAAAEPVSRWRNESRREQVAREPGA